MSGSISICRRMTLWWWWWMLVVVVAAGAGAECTAWSVKWRQVHGGAGLAGGRWLRVMTAGTRPHAPHKVEKVQATRAPI